MQVWYSVITLSCLFVLGISSSLSKTTQISPLPVRGPSHEESIDKALYSRQLLVYGESAQLQLKHASIVMIGDGALYNEIAKNIALAGVGRIVFVEVSRPPGAAKAPSLTGQAATLAQYVADLNHNVEVSLALPTSP